jgi:hypothetical protein
MAAVELDRQGIERRDFPIGRRGYDPTAVDAHLRAVAVEVEELQRAALGAGHDLSLASAAGNQVQSVIEAAEAAAAEIERQAVEGARQAREAADRDAERTREEAVETARAHVAGVAQVASSLLERVGAMDAEVRALLDSLRAGAGRLAADLAAVEANMGELYDAAAGQTYGPPAQAYGPSGQAYAPPQQQPQFDVELAGAMEAPPPPQPVAVAPAATAGDAAHQAAPDDIDGARLIALNMALNGESRADTERYLAENFQLPDRVALIDEVYAAIEG